MRVAGISRQFCHGGVTCAERAGVIARAIWARYGRPEVCRHIFPYVERDLPVWRTLLAGIADFGVGFEIADAVFEAVEDRPQPFDLGALLEHDLVERVEIALQVRDEKLDFGGAPLQFVWITHNKKLGPREGDHTRAIVINIRLKLYASGPG